MKKYLVVFALLFVFSNSQAQKMAPFKIGAETLLPFEYQKDGKSMGINIQIIDTIFKKLNIPYEIVFGNEGERAFDMLKHNKVDAILSISFKSDRLEVLWYPKGFENEDAPKNFMWASEYVFFAKKGNVTAYSKKTLAELKQDKLKVGVINGVSYSQEFWDAKLMVVKGTSDEENFAKLQSGEIDLYLTDKTIGRFTLKNLNLSDEIAYLPQRVLSKPYTLAFSKNSKHPKIEQLKTDFFKELEWVKKSGFARKLFMDYLQQ